MIIPLIDSKDVFSQLQNKTHPYLEEYYAFYSSWFGGIIKNSPMMLIPIDDHMVHRGDGVFEAMKAVSRSIYLLEEHLNRLFLSAERIALEIPVSFDEMKEIVIQTLRIADKTDALVRIFVSRGPGSFSVCPYDSIGSQVYVVITKLTTPAAEKYEQGVILGKSAIPVKAPWFAQIKTCNYLANVLMKKEAVDRSLDFVVGVDERGYITESATENVMIVDANGLLVYPLLDTILKGTIMMRACELADENGIKTESRLISIADLLSAREVMIAGTSLNVLPAVQFEGQKIGNGRPGLLTQKILRLIQEDVETGPRRTAY